jgi:hypothetical protein
MEARDRGAPSPTLAATFAAFTTALAILSALAGAWAAREDVDVELRRELDERRRAAQAGVAELARVAEAQKALRAEVAAGRAAAIEAAALRAALSPAELPGLGDVAVARGRVATGLDRLVAFEGREDVAGATLSVALPALAAHLRSDVRPLAVWSEGAETWAAGPPDEVGIRRVVRIQDLRPAAEPPRGPDAGPWVAAAAAFAVEVEPWRRAARSGAPAALVLFVGGLLLALWANRATSRPLARVHAAGEAWLHGEEMPALAVGGPREVRAIARLFERVAAEAEQRGKRASAPSETDTPLASSSASLVEAGEASARGDTPRAAVDRAVDEVPDAPAVSPDLSARVVGATRALADELGQLRGRWQGARLDPAPTAIASIERLAEAARALARTTQALLAATEVATPELEAIGDGLDRLAAARADRAVLGELVDGIAAALARAGALPLGDVEALPPATAQAVVKRARAALAALEVEIDCLGRRFGDLALRGPGGAARAALDQVHDELSDAGGLSATLRDALADDRALWAETRVGLGRAAVGAEQLDAATRAWAAPSSAGRPAEDTLPAVLDALATRAAEVEAALDRKISRLESALR